MKNLVLVLFAVGLFTADAQSRKIAVFTSGTEGFKSFRIPALVMAPDGDILAFCEGRVNGSADFGNVKIVMKRSSDHGRTWGPLQIVASNDTLQAGNAAPVVDMLDPVYPKGRIFLFYCTGNKSESSLRGGHGVREVWYKTSADNGQTWSAPVNITLQVHRPNQPSWNPEYHFPEDWRSFATAPGHAIQLKGQQFSGRIFVATNHSAGPPQAHFKDYSAGGFYTDDHGKTFHMAADVPIPGGNENMAAELSGGRLMLNLRNQGGSPKCRIVALSRNGGESWDTTYFDKQLPDPVCQGSILTIAVRKNSRVIAVCNNADTMNRNHLLLRVSFDEGKTWVKNYSVDSAGAQDNPVDYTAYSDMVQLPAHQIGVLYERDNYKTIIFSMIKW